LFKYFLVLFLIGSSSLLFGQNQQVHLYHSIGVAVAQPFWSAWWFGPFAGVFIAGKILMFYYYKVNKIGKQKIILERQVEERTVEVRKQAEILQIQSGNFKILNEELRLKSEDLQALNEELQ